MKIAALRRSHTEARCLASLRPLFGCCSLSFPTQGAVAWDREVAFGKLHAKSGRAARAGGEHSSGRCDALSVSGASPCRALHLGAEVAIDISGAAVKIVEAQRFPPA